MSNSPQTGERPKHAIILAPGTVGPDASQMIEYGIAAEEVGWDGAFLYDILVNPPPSEVEGAAGDPTPGWNPNQYFDFIDPWMTLAAIASHTSTVTLGTYITPIPRRQPWQVARDVATVDRISNGRIMFGAGLGRRPDYDKFGDPWNARAMAERYDEALELIARFWTGERVSYEGEHFTVDDVALLPTPAQQPRVPILIAGFWPNKKPFQRGARWDGIMPFFFSGNDHPPAADVVREMLAYYHDLTDEPGDIFLPLDPPGNSPEYLDVCREFGVTWLYTYPSLSGERDQDLEQIRRGPPR